MSAIPCGLMGLYKDYWFILSVMFMFILCLFSGGGSTNLWLVGGLSHVFRVSSGGLLV